MRTRYEKWLNLTTRNVYDLFDRGNKEGLFRDLSIDNLLKIYFRIQSGYIYELILENRIPSKSEIDEVWKIYWDGIKA